MRGFNDTSPPTFAVTDPSTAYGRAHGRWPATRSLKQRRLVTEIPGPRSRALAARRAAAVAPGVSTLLPVYIDRAEGAILVDVDGNCFIDLGSGIAVTSIGHGVAPVVEAVQEQMPPVFPHLLHDRRI